MKNSILTKSKLQEIKAKREMQKDKPNEKQINYEYFAI